MEEETRGQTLLPASRLPQGRAAVQLGTCGETATFPGQFDDRFGHDQRGTAMADADYHDRGGAARSFIHAAATSRARSG